MQNSNLQNASFQNSKFQQSGIHNSLVPWIHACADERPSRLNARDTRRIGEMGEASFVLKAEALNFHVSRPWSQNNRYDFVLDSGKRLHRMQLKCTEALNKSAYQVHPLCASYGQKPRPYTAADIDFLVAYILPRHIWYVIPIAALEGEKCLRFYPDRTWKRSIWEIYREAWDLLRHPE